VIIVECFGCVVFMVLATNFQGLSTEKQSGLTVPVLAAVPNLFVARPPYDYLKTS